MAVRSTQGRSERTAIQVLALLEMHLARGLLTVFTLLTRAARHLLRRGVSYIHFDYRGIARDGQEHAQSVSGGQQTEARHVAEMAEGRGGDAVQDERNDDTCRLSCHSSASSGHNVAHKNSM